MIYTSFLDLFSSENLKNPSFIAKAHSCISQYNKPLDKITVPPPYFDNVDGSKFFTLYGSLVGEVVDTLCHKDKLKHKALQLLRWSQSESGWNDIFISKLADLDPSKPDNIISDSKFDILKNVQFPYSIALALQIDELATSECIAEPIITSFCYNFENSVSKLSNFSKIENAFTFIKLQLDLLVSIVDKSWQLLEENSDLLKNSIKIDNSGHIIDNLLCWKPIEAIGLVLAKYFRNFIIKRLSYFVYDYLDASTDLPVSMGDLVDKNILCTGITTNEENVKVCKTLIGGLFNLAIKWNQIDRNSAMELLKDETIPPLVDSIEDDSISLMEFWLESCQSIENIVPMVFDTSLIHIFEEVIQVISKHVEVVAKPQIYVESTIGVFIKSTLELVKNKWNEIDNIIDSIELSTKYLNMISEIISVCEKSGIKSLIQLEEIYSMREKMQEIFVICFDEYLQGKIKYILNRILIFTVLEEKINSKFLFYIELLLSTRPLSYTEIFSQLANKVQKTIIDLIIPNDNLMVIKSEYHLNILCENLRELKTVLPYKLPYITELLYILENCKGQIDTNYFTVLNNEQIQQATKQALHAKMKKHDSTLNPKLSI